MNQWKDFASLSTNIRSSWPKNRGESDAERTSRVAAKVTERHFGGHDDSEISVSFFLFSPSETETRAANQAR